jgi:hypothetical protein
VNNQLEIDSVNTNTTLTGSLTIKPSLQSYSGNYVTIELKELLQELHSLRARVEWLEETLQSQHPTPWSARQGNIPDQNAVNLDQPNVNIVWRHL